MSDRRIVQCFGIKRKPHKQDKVCKKRFLWTAKGAASGSFGGNGTQACPNCGTLPEHGHPANKYLNGELSKEDAPAAMEAYKKKQEELNK